MDLSNMVQFLLFSKKIFEEVFLCCPDCPKMKRISLITITPTIKVQILRAMAGLKALSNPHLPKKFQKIHIQIGITTVCPEPPNSIYGSHGPLGVMLCSGDHVVA